jgi:hypothetical protein
MASIRELDYRKVCATWVSIVLTVEHKTARTKVCAELLQRTVKEGDTFLSKIITGDEPCIHHYDPLAKIQSME